MSAGLSACCARRTHSKAWLLYRSALSIVCTHFCTPMRNVRFFSGFPPFRSSGQFRGMELSNYAAGWFHNKPTNSRVRIWMIQKFIKNMRPNVSDWQKQCHRLIERQCLRSRRLGSNALGLQAQRDRATKQRCGQSSDHPLILQTMKKRALMKGPESDPTCHSGTAAHHGKRRTDM